MSDKLHVLIRADDPQHEPHRNWELPTSRITHVLTAEVFVGPVLNRTSVLRFVVDDNLSEVRVMQESLTFADGSTPPTIVTFEGRRIFNNQGND